MNGCYVRQQSIAQNWLEKPIVAIAARSEALVGLRYYL